MSNFHHAKWRQGIIYPGSTNYHSNPRYRYFFLTFLLNLFFLFHSVTGTLTNSAGDNVFVKNLKVKGKGSTFDVDLYGLAAIDIEKVIPSIRDAYKILSNNWKSKIVVKTRITFINLGRPQALASGGGVLFVRFGTSPDRELLPIAAAEAITERDLNANEKGTDVYDVLVKVNLNTPWHLDVNSKPSQNKYDLVTVLLHETYHNLLFSGAVAVKADQKKIGLNGVLLDGHPARFDLFLANDDGCAVLDYRHDDQLSKSLNVSKKRLFAASVMNNRLYFSDEESGLRIPLYSPPEYQEKSSIYHIDTARGGKGTIMNRYIPSGFMHREIHEEVKRIQKVFLNPSVRGARHCKFPLANPIPRGKINHVDAFGLKADPTQIVPSIGVIITACILVVVTGIIAFVCISSFVTKRGKQADNANKRRKSRSDPGTMPVRSGDTAGVSETGKARHTDQGVSHESVSIEI